MALDPSTISAIAAGISTSIGGFFYKRLQSEIKKRPDLNGHVEAVNQLRRRTILLKKRLDKAEDRIVLLEKDCNRLTGDCSRLSTRVRVLEESSS